MLLKVKRIFRKILSITNWKRWTIIAITAIASILAVIFGSLFYVSKNVNKSIEYGGGVEFLVQVNDENNKNTEESTKTVVQALEERLTGGIALNGTNVSVEGDGKIRISKSGNLTEEQRLLFEQTISKKPTLVLTDSEMRPLFYEGKFVENATIDYNNIEKYLPPLKIGAAKSEYNNYGNNSSYSIYVELADNDAQIEWTKATEYVSSKTQTILMWLNLDELVELAETKYNDAWNKANKNPYNFVYVDETPYDQTNNQPNILKSVGLNARNYLISVANIGQALNGKSFSITGNFDSQTSKQLAANINYGVSKYNLSVLSSNYIDTDKSSNAFRNMMIAGLIIFSAIAIFMIVNYGLLGGLSTISMALYIFLTLLLFTVLRGEYSPITVISLVAGIIISFSSHITNYERLKNELYAGEKLKKAIKNANKLSVWNILDTNIIILLGSLIMFYFGSRIIQSYSISVIFSSIFVLTSVLIINRLMSTMLINTGLFNNKLHLLGIKQKKINHLSQASLFTKVNYYKNSKWLIIASLIMIIIGIIVFSSLAGVSQNILAGFNRSFEFQGGMNISIKGSDSLSTVVDFEQATEIRNYLINNANIFNINNANSVISIVPVDTLKTQYKVIVETTQDLSQNLQAITKSINDNFKNVEVLSYLVSATESKLLVQNILTVLSITIAIFFIYVFVRFKWTYALSILTTLIHDIILFTAIVVIVRIPVSEMFIIALATVLIYSTNEKLILFSKIKEQMSNEFKQSIVSKQQIINIVNSSINYHFKQLLFTLIASVVMICVFITFWNIVSWTIVIMLMLGFILSTYSTYSLLIWLWAKLENSRQRGIQKRTDSKYWDLPGPTEQTFANINDFVA